MHSFKIRVSAFLVGFLTISQFGISQFYETGQDPFSIRWKQINTEHYQVIFPEEFEAEAQRLSSILNYVYYYVPWSLHHAPRKVSVIIHNETFYSNGTVVWAPKRVEMYTTPPQDIYPMDWLCQLAIHESRHVVQIDKMDQGINKVLSYIMGEQALGATLGLIPSWFFEGDAVVTETALSHSGRGSMPSFDMHLRTLELESTKRYSYEKTLFGSFKDYVPNHYQYGYHMVAYGRIQHNPDLWSKTLNYTAQKPYTCYPFYFALKKYAGLSKNKLYHASFDYFREAWSKEQAKVTPSDYRIINQRTDKDFTTYQYPCFLNDTTLLVATHGLSKYHSFVTIDSEGNEKILAKPGARDGVSLSAANNKIAWEEYCPDPRWENRSTSIIKVLDTQTGEKTIIDYKTRLFSPSISPDGKKVAAIDIGKDNANALVIFDSKNGTILKHIFVPDNLYIQIPSWTNEGDGILFTFMHGDKKGIGHYHFERDEWDILLEGGYNDISNVTDGGEHIFFHANYSGIDNIYALNKTSHEIIQVTRSKYGACYPRVSPQGDFLYYCDYSALGFNVVKTLIDTAEWVKLKDIIPQSAGVDEMLRKQESKIIETSQIPIDKFMVKPYRRLTHLFNFHSWLPFYFDYNDFDISFDGYELQPGLTLLSQDKFSTAFTQIGYSYHNSRHHFYTGFTYKGLLPIISIDGGFGGIPSVFPVEYADSIDIPLGNNQYYTFNTYVPLNFSRGNFTTMVIPRFEISREKTYYRNFISDNYNNQVTFTRFSFSIYNYRRSLARDIYPRWGQVLHYYITSAPFEKTLIGNIQALQTYWYFPGIIKHHSLNLYGGIQKQVVDQYYFGSFIEFARGYTIEPKHVKMLKGSVNYTLPLVYPDVNLGRVLYLNRIHCNMFYDHVLFEQRTYNESLDKIEYNTYYAQSGGLELFTNFHFAHIIFPFEVGGRYSYVLNENTSKFEVLFRLNTGIF